MRVERVVYGVPNLGRVRPLLHRLRAGAADGGGTGARFGTQTGQVVELRDGGRPGPAARGAGRAEPARDRLGRRHAGVARQAGDRTCRPTGRSTPTRTAWRTPSTRPASASGWRSASRSTWNGRPYPGSNRTGNVNRWNEPMEPPGPGPAAAAVPRGARTSSRRARRRPSPSTPTGSASCRPTGSAKVGVFMRAPGDTDHHTLLLVPPPRPERRSTTCAYEVARVDEVIVGANDMIEQGLARGPAARQAHGRVEHLPVHPRALRRPGRVRRRHGPGRRELRAQRLRGDAAAHHLDAALEAADAKEGDHSMSR